MIKYKIIKLSNKKDLNEKYYNVITARDLNTSPEILALILQQGKDDYVSINAAKNENAPSEALAKVLRRGDDDYVSQYASENLNCPPEALAEVLRRGNDDWISRSIASNLNTPPEALAEVLRRGKNDEVSINASKNPKSHYEEKLKWILDVDDIEQEDEEDFVQNVKKPQDNDELNKLRNLISSSNWYKKVKAMPLMPVTNEYTEDSYNNRSVINMDLSLKKETIDRHEESRKYLGSGFFGVAYDIPSGYVEKITIDAEDYNNAKEIIKRYPDKNFPPPFCVGIYDAELIQEEPVFYKIIAEKVNPLSLEQDKIFWEYYMVIKSELKRTDLGITSKETLNFEKNKIRYPLIKKIEKFIKELKRNRIRFWDIKSGNVGLREEDIVILDIGAFSFKEKI